MGTLGRSLSSNKGKKGKKIPHRSGHKQLLPSLTNKQHKVGGEVWRDLLAHTPRSGSRKLRSGVPGDCTSRGHWEVTGAQELPVLLSTRHSRAPQIPGFARWVQKRGQRWCNWLDWSSGVSLWDVPPALDHIPIGVLSLPLGERSLAHFLLSPTAT